MKCQSQRKGVGYLLARNSWLGTLFSREVNQHRSEGVNPDCDSVQFLDTSPVESLSPQCMEAELMG